MSTASLFSKKSLNEGYEFMNYDFEQRNFANEAKKVCFTDYKKY